MLFLAHINDLGDTQVVTDYDDDGTKKLSRIFCTVAVTQYQIEPIEQKRAVMIKGKMKEKTLYAMDAATKVQGQGRYHFTLPLDIKILDALSIGYQTGAIAKTTIVDLREDNWDQIKADYAQKSGHFNYMRKVIK